MREHELLLACDTSTPYCALSLCAFNGEEKRVHLRANYCVERHRLHAEGLLSGTHQMLEAASCTLDDISYLAVASGPGSFTGLRVGLATWKGLAFALRLPLIAVPTLDAMARLVPLYDGIALPLIDARMNEVFAAAYRYFSGTREKIISDAACSVEALITQLGEQPGPILFFGDGAERYASEIKNLLPSAHLVAPESTTPRADTVAAEAYALLQQGVETDPALAAPTYLRRSQAEQARDASLQSKTSP
ncbi:MAG: tRNA (adenosine(37)-N6)-threonylcarbamoyltransferase complex dimerization subunit type 1 TsaB [Candidatus Hydrogenedentes bacterium]|jgi:tRNA threonylcarbamoyladenosine biosynthesis protein TsaB|nr:tRNA (adenosine(37)-N6)-threonylcarbamoyltransferase complex dimerization subunit type 1 TsaB [Candidatus Hydrogenedentota bacterium]